jgi:dihydrofolate reductase
MRKLVLTVFDYSLDGIIGEEDTEFFKFCREVPDDPAHEAGTLDCLQRADVHIMGRVTYQGMAQYFPTATDHPYAEVMNKGRKAVFSGTLETAGWANSTIGASFAQSLVRLGLVDEYRLNVFPYLAGRGRRLFADLPGPQRIEHASSTLWRPFSPTRNPRAAHTAVLARKRMPAPGWQLPKRRSRAPDSARRNARIGARRPAIANSASRHSSQSGAIAAMRSW